MQPSLSQLPDDVQGAFRALKHTARQDLGPVCAQLRDLARTAASREPAEPASPQDAAEGQYKLRTAWGWAKGLEQVQASLTSQPSGEPGGRSGPGPPQTSQPVPLAQLMAASPAAQAPHAVRSILGSCAPGLGALHDALSASALLGMPSEARVDALRGALKLRINSGWSHEALRQGVAYAKTGQYPDARRCYDKAIELWPDNADAFVARGAAAANERQLVDAASDLQHALSLDPGNANASRYLDLVKAKAAVDGVSLGATAPAPSSATLLDQHKAETATPGPTRGTMADRSKQKEQPAASSSSSEGSSGSSSDSGDSHKAAGGGSAARRGQGGSTAHEAPGSTFKAALHAVLQAREQDSGRHRRKGKHKSKKRKHGKKDDSKRKSKKRRH